MILWIDRAMAHEWGNFPQGPRGEYDSPEVPWCREMQEWIDRFLHYGAKLKHFVDFEAREDSFGVEFASDRDFCIFRLYFMPTYTVAANG